RSISLIRPMVSRPPGPGARARLARWQPGAAPRSQPPPLRRLRLLPGLRASRRRRCRASDGSRRGRGPSGGIGGGWMWSWVTRFQDRVDVWLVHRVDVDVRDAVIRVGVLTERTVRVPLEAAEVVGHQRHVIDEDLAVSRAQAVPVRVPGGNVDAGVADDVGVVPLGRLLEGALIAEEIRAVRLRLGVRVAPAVAG